MFDSGNEVLPGQYERTIEKSVLSAARLPFTISLLCVVTISTLYLLDKTNLFKELSPTVSPSVALTIPERLLENSIYFTLGLIAIFSSYIGYRLIVAAGAARSPVIPPEDYALLAPLVADGKTEAIDQYVRLSSLAKFTGTFTQLGLTGLPLATIFLTIFFSGLTLVQSGSFLDLTKLTLGAFIGSFVQRQIERRAEATDKSPSSLTEASPPKESA